MQKKNVDFSTFLYMAQSQNIYWRRFLTEAFISLPQNNIFVNTKNRRILPPVFRGNKFKEIPFMGTLLSIAQNRARVKQKDRRTIFSLSRR